METTHPASRARRPLRRAARPRPAGRAAGVRAAAQRDYRARIAAGLAAVARRARRTIRRQLDADPRRVDAAGGRRAGRRVSAARHRRQPGRCRPGRAGAFPAPGAGARNRPAARAAARRSAGHAASTTTIALQQQFAKAGDFESFIAGDNDFHAQLYAAAGKQELWTLVRSRSGHIDRLRRLHLPSPGKAQNIVRHHKLITRAIEAGDADAAQQHLRKHLSGTLSELATIRSHYPEYLTD